MYLVNKMVPTHFTQKDKTETVKDRGRMRSKNRRQHQTKKMFMTKFNVFLTAIYYLLDKTSFSLKNIFKGACTGTCI